MPTTDPTQPNHWHLDKKVPITLIVTVMVQTIAMIVYFARLESRVQRLEESRAEQWRRDDNQDMQAQAAVNLMRAQLERIDSKIDRLIERSTAPHFGGKGLQ